MDALDRRFLRCSSRTDGAPTTTSPAGCRCRRRRSSGGSTGCATRGALPGLHRGGRPRRRSGDHTEALIELFYAPGDAARRGRRDPARATPRWSRRGASPARPTRSPACAPQDNADLERLIMDLQRDGLVERTRSQVVMSRLVSRPVLRASLRSASLGPGTPSGQLPSLFGSRTVTSAEISAIPATDRRP